MIFIDNKYTKWYNNIISTAKSRISPIGYTEIHHIIPKSIGGDNTQQNLVILTAREHFVCHLLLTKMTYGKYKRNMHFALWALSNKMKHTENLDAHNFIINSRFYKQARENFSLENSKTHKGKVLPQEPRDKLSKAHKGKKLTDEHKAKINPSGRKHTEESKHKISQGLKGRVGGMQDKHHSRETKNKISAGNKGKHITTLTAERKQQISKQFSGIAQTEEHILKRVYSRQENGYYKDASRTKKKMSDSAKNRPKLKCHCGKECSPSNYKRWHGDNCRIV